MNKILVLIVDFENTLGDKEYWLRVSESVFRKEAEKQGRYYSLEEFETELNVFGFDYDNKVIRFIEE